MTSSHELARELVVAFRDDVGPRTRPPAAPAPVATSDPVALQPFDAARADLATVLHERRSTRFFGPQPLPASAVRDLALDALAADQREAPLAAAACPLQVFVLALRLDGLAPGAYRLDDDGRLWPLGDLGCPTADLTIQAEFADAAAIVSLAGDLTAADAASGAHGYRQLMTRAGAAAYDMWLDAVALGWAGTVFAGFIPASVRLPLASDGTDRHQLFALALGHPVSLPAAESAVPTPAPGRRDPHGSDL
ncbi:MAG: nitroreductase family protein [Angustibacter sp.]